MQFPILLYFIWYALIPFSIILQLKKHTKFPDGYQNK